MAKINVVKLALIMPALVAAPAYAQSVLPQQQQAPHVILSVSAKGLYDTNIARASDAAIAQRGLEKSDFKMTPLVSADIYKPFGTSYVSLVGSAGYDFHARNTILNRERIDLTGGLGSQVGPCGANVTGGYARRQSDLADLNVLTVGTALTTKNTESIFHVEGLVACGAPVGFKPFGTIAYSNARNSSDRRKGSDANSVTYGGGILYTQPSIGEIRLFGAQRDINFPNRDGVNYFGAPKLRARFGGVRFERNIGARLSGHAQVAYTDVERRGTPATKSFNGVTWELGLNLRASERLSIDATASRNVDPSLGFNVDYIVQEEYELRAAYVLNRLMTLTLTGTHMARDFNYSSTATSIPINNDKTDSIVGALHIEPIGRFSLILDGGYTRRNANVNFYDYNSFRTSVTIATQF